jgi:hypothetical protein
MGAFGRRLGHAAHRLPAPAHHVVPGRADGEQHVRPGVAVGHGKDVEPVHLFVVVGEPVIGGTDHLPEIVGVEMGHRPPGRIFGEEIVAFTGHAAGRLRVRSHFGKWLICRGAGRNRSRRFIDICGFVDNIVHNWSPSLSGIGWSGAGWATETIS